MDRFSEDLNHLKELLGEALTFNKTLKDTYEDTNINIDIIKNTELCIEKLIGEIATDCLYSQNITTPKFSISRSASRSPPTIIEPIKEIKSIIENDLGYKDDNEFKLVSNKKLKKHRELFMIHDVKILPGMVIDTISNYKEYNITNRSEVNNLKFYFKDPSFFDRRRGLYIFNKGSDKYYICENNKLYKFDDDNNLIPGKFHNADQVWREVSDLEF